MARQKVLLPYDFSAWDRKALEFLITTFAGRSDVEVTLFHVYPPLPKLEPTTDAITSRIKTGMNFLTQELARKEEEIVGIIEHLKASGFEDDQLKRVFRPRSKDVAEEILETLKKGFFDVVILSQRKDRITRFFVRNIMNKVLANLQGVTACVIT